MFDEATPLYERLLHDIDMADAEERRLNDPENHEMAAQRSEPVPQEVVQVDDVGDDFEEEFDSDDEGPQS